MALNENKPVSPVLRPPIVAVLGHVDHGKTSLLDKIRQSRVAEKEAGGITQKIGAYQIEFNHRKITFIDTPGHQAFSAMRSRGAKVADIVILVVAADDGVMPQTIESINHIQNAKVPYIIVINKIDVQGANVISVKDQLAQNGVPLEGYGGDIVTVSVSAKTGEGINDLLEMILLISEMNNVVADSCGEINGIIIESKKDQRGYVGTAIIRNGTLHTGDTVSFNGGLVKIKGLFDQNGKPVILAEPGKPVEILGFTQLPPVGEEILSSGQPTICQQISTTFQHLSGDKPELKIIINVDSQGSREALCSCLPAGVEILDIQIGDVNESEILLAKGGQAEIWGFGVKISAGVMKLAETEKVTVKNFRIIYEFLEELEQRIQSGGESKNEKILGKAEIIAAFTIDKKPIIGARVIEGRINKTDKIKITRNDKPVGESLISSLKQQKEEVHEVLSGDEFGLNLASTLDFKIGDMVISYRSI